MAITIINATDSGSPTLTGSAGSLINVLNYCLPTAGWTQANTGTNTSIWQQGTNSAKPNLTQMYIYVNDNGPGSQTYQEARFYACEQVVSITQQYGVVPLASQSTIGLVCRKSATLDSTTARDWVFVGNSRTFYLFICTGDIANQYDTISFGDIASEAQNDIYPQYIQGKITEASTTGYTGYLAGTSISASSSGHYMMRDSFGSLRSIAVGKTLDYVKTSGGNIGVAGLIYPSPVNAGLYMCRIDINHAAGNTYGFRGCLPGLWAPCHAKPLNGNSGVGNYDTFTGVGEMAGRTFRAINLISAGQIFIETSNTWLMGV